MTHDILADGERKLDEALHLADRMLTPAEVAKLFRVDPKTVARWATQGKIPACRTPGGHRRFPESEVRKFFQVFKNGKLEYEVTLPPGMTQETLW
jgi:excisionase family DNA binding protein